MALINNFQTVVCPASENNLRNSEGDIVQLPNGDLLLAWSNFIGSFEDHAEANISAKISKDGGYTWSESFVLQPNSGKVNVMSVSFLKFNEDILMFYLVKNSTADDFAYYVRKSSDGAKTWGDPIKVSKLKGCNVINNGRVILTTSNRIIVSAAYCKDISKDFHAVGICYYSDDGGETWEKSEDEVRLEDSATGVQEPGLIELKDKSLMMTIRSDKGYIYKSKSYDFGITWSKPEPMQLVSSCSPSTIKRIPDTDKLLIIWNPSIYGKYAKWSDRWPLCSAISEDEGQTWSNVKYLEGTPEICHAYTSVTFIKEKAYLTYYEWNNTPNIRGFERTSLKLRIVDKNWFYT